MPLDDFIIYVYCYVADIFPQVVDVSLRRRCFQLKLTDSGKWSASFGKDKHRRDKHRRGEFALAMRHDRILLATKSWSEILPEPIHDE